MNRNIKELTPGFFVSSQLFPADLQGLVACGIKTIINNRLDLEEAGQPSDDLMAAQARAVGLAYVHLPVVSGQLSDRNADDFKDLLSSVDKPVLAFCRTGCRCVALWALSQAGIIDIGEILDIARGAGHDLTALSPWIAKRSRME